MRSRKSFTLMNMLIHCIGIIEKRKANDFNGGMKKKMQKTPKKRNFSTYFCLHFLSAKPFSAASEPGMFILVGLSFDYFN